VLGLEINIVAIF